MRVCDTVSTQTYSVLARYVEFCTKVQAYPTPTHICSTEAFMCIYLYFSLCLSLQMLAFLDLVTCFNELHSQIKVVGIELSISEGILVQLKDSQLMRFKLGYMDSWKRYKTICSRLSKFYMCMWVMWSANFSFQLFYSIRSVVGAGFQISLNSSRNLKASLFPTAPYGHTASL